jgi:hypothetical protein
VAEAADDGRVAEAADDGRVVGAPEDGRAVGAPEDVRVVEAPERLRVVAHATVYAIYRASVYTRMNCILAMRDNGHKALCPLSCSLRTVAVQLS